jgi:non-ribosomal peptide synthase protein (TIGR01720 family)
VNEPTTDIYESKPDDIVFYQLTSGSTGVPKCIQERHSGIISHIHGAQQFNGYTSSNVSLNWLPMDHVVPILTCHLKDVYLGCTQIEIRTETILTQPLKWLDYIEKHRVTHTWSPNFGYKLVSDCLAKNEKKVWDLSSMQYFLNAGEQVTLPVITEFLRLVAPFHIEPSAMQPSFGMAEACTCMTFQREFDIAGGVHLMEKSSLSGRLRKATEGDPHVIAFVDLGGPVPGIQIRITDANNQLVPEGVIGRFQIKGPVITPGYYKNEKANEEAFIGDGWFNSGDLGFILNGRLTLTGREKEIIVINGANHYCYEIEDVINNVPGVEPTFVGTCGVADPKTGTEGLVIFFTSVFENIEECIALIPTIRMEVITRIGLNPLYIIPVEKKDFPKTTSGKIQRTQLKKAFQNGEFDALLKDIDIHLANNNTLPDWFYQKVWVRRNIALQTPPHLESGAILIMSDSLGLSEQLQIQLERNGRLVVRIENGANFVRLDARHYRIDPMHKEHFIEVIRLLHEDGLFIKQIVHLQTYSEYAGEFTSSTYLENSQQAINASLLHIAQALQRIYSDSQSVDFYLVGSYSQSVSAKDLIALEKLALAGLLKTIGQEFTWLRCRQIDLPVADPAANAALLMQELYSLQHDTTVAYRTGIRLIQWLRKLDWVHESAQKSLLVQGGFYLISGGLGGVGFEVACYLLKHCQARLLLVGRRSLPPRDLWATLIANGDPSASLIARYQELARIGGEVTYISANICDQETIERAVHEQEVYYDHPLDGVFHLAGIFRERLLIEETTDSLAEVLQAKVSGTWVLHQLVKERPDSLFIAFSSVNGLLGGVSAGAYSAANSFLDTFTQYQHEYYGLRSYCFAWSMWDEVGISRGSRTKELALARGYYPITSKQGLYSLLAGLCRNQAYLLIGLDNNNVHIRRLTETASYSLQKGVMYFVARSGIVSSVDLQAAQVYDRFCVRSNCEFVQLKEMPKTLTGDVDREKLSLLGKEQHRRNPEYVAPRTQMERQLASVWQEILGIERIGIYDSFFRLGGDSIQVLQLISKANQAGLRFTLEEVFQHQTIAALATIAITESQDRVEVGQDTITGPAPLMPSQAWFFERDLPDSNHFNQSLMFEVTQQTDATSLEKAVFALLHHHEALRLRFVHTESGWQQFDPGPVQTAPFSCIDMSKVSAKERDAAIAAEEMRLQRGLSLTKGPLVQIALFRLGADTPSRLLVLFHHVIIDGVSWRIILEDLQDAYHQASNAKYIHLPPKTISTLYWATRLSEYAQSAELRSELDYWLEKSRTQMLPLPLDFPDGENRVGSARLFSVSLSIEETRALLQEATRTYRVQFDIVLLAAVTRAFAKWTGGLPLLVDLVNHGREAFIKGADVSRSVGWFSMNVPVLFEVGNTSEPEALIQTIGQQLRAAPSYQGTGYNLLRYLSEDKEVREKLRALQQAQVLFSYIGRFDPGPTTGEHILLGPTLESNNQDSDPDALRPYIFVITAVITDGRLNIEFFYNENMHRSVTVEALAFDCLAVLRSLIAETHSSTAPSI